MMELKHWRWMTGCDMEFYGSTETEPIRSGMGNITFPPSWSFEQRADWRKRHFILGHSFDPFAKPQRKCPSCKRPL